jgi:hypothetical protein
MRPFHGRRGLVPLLPAGPTGFVGFEFAEADELRFIL